MTIRHVYEGVTLERTDYVSRIFLMLMAGLVLIQLLPSVLNVFPNYDSGTYLYIGWRWLEGDIP